MPPVPASLAVLALLVALAPPSGAGPVAPAAAAAPVAHAASEGEPTLGPLLSGRTSWVGGTHVWTDYAYDDRGRDASAAATYPAVAAPGNAADLVQLQLRVDGSALHVRAVLETLTDAAVPSLGLGLDTDASPATGALSVPGGGWTVQAGGARLGLERTVVLERGQARVLAADPEAPGGWRAEPVGSAPARIDPRDNTITAQVPLALLGGGARWRVAGVVGLADPAHAWHTGAGPVRDLAYVHDGSFDGASFQSAAQAAVLSGTADAAAAVAALDLASSRAGTTQLARPEPGRKNTALYRSALSLGEGISATADRKYAGPYQPYVLWFPESGLPARPPLVLFLHGASQTHLDGPYGEGGSFAGDGATGIGPGLIAPAAVVVTPLGRNEAVLGYPGPSEQDILDVLADASARFDVDPDRVVLTGYSLGGVGTFNLAQFYPDRWAGAVEIVGAHDLGALTLQEEAGGTQTQPNALENLRNLPFRMAHARLDELELIVGDAPDLAYLALEQLGYDLRYYQFYRREHLTFPVVTIQCELEAAAARGRVRDPARVTYVQEPAIRTDDATTGLRLQHDRAYWMSDMRVHDAGEPGFAPGEKGTVDLLDLTRVDRATTVTPVREAHENVTAGRDVCGPNAAVQTQDAWSTLGNAVSRGPDQARVNGLQVTLTGVDEVTVDLARLRGLDLARPVSLQVDTDVPAVLRLAAPWRGAVSVVRAGAAPYDACARDGVLDVELPAGSGLVRLAATTRPCR